MVEFQSYIHLATEGTLNKYKDHLLKLVSDDKKYLLVYTQANLNELMDYYDWLYEQGVFADSSPSDLDYETLLVDAGIKKPFNPELYVSSFVKLDDKTEKLISFLDSNMAISHVVCNLKELSTSKALAKFVMIAASVQDGGKSIKEVIPTGYFTFKLRGSK